MRTPLEIALAACLLAASCANTPTVESVAPATRIDPAKLVDLTYTFNEQTVYWPNAEGFRHHKSSWEKAPGGYWYAAGEFSSAEHGGTHMDSPIHFTEGMPTLDLIPVSDLIAPAVVIDVSESAAQNPDYLVTPADITNWEQEHSTIGRGTIAVIRTGWGRYYPDRKQYLGCDVPGDVSNLHFPGLSREAAELLVKRDVVGVGIDTASLDYGPSTEFLAHQALTGAGLYGIENIANAEVLPATGATLIALPMKIAEGTGGPVRLVALLP